MVSCRVNAIGPSARQPRNAVFLDRGLRDRVAEFIAPERIRKRGAEWGGDGFRDRTTAAWTGFLKIAPNLASIALLTGPDAACPAYLPHARRR